MASRDSRSNSSEIKNRAQQPYTPINAALEYAQRDLWVFPCHGIIRPGWGIEEPSCTCPLGADCPNARAGKHPRSEHGFRDATLDPKVILSWRRDSNIAIATGEVSKIFVMDVDPRNGGVETL